MLVFLEELYLVSNALLVNRALRLRNIYVKIKA